MPIDNQLWSLAIVGNGSSAAYYVATVDLNDYPSILAIGQGDPWNGPRGHVGKSAEEEGDEQTKRDPTRYINHPLHLIAHFRKTIPGFSGELVDRMKWAEMNAEVLQACNVTVHNAEVSVVEEADYPIELVPENMDQVLKGFKIALKDGTNVYAHKVVMATGTGGHRIPDFAVNKCNGCQEAKKAAPLRVVDLDEFARLGPLDLTANTTVMVLGTNAAIDAIQKSVYYKCKLHWLIDGKTNTGRLPILDSQPTVKEKVKNDPGMFVKHDLIALRAIGTDAVNVDVTFENKVTSYKVDYFVYGVGPTGSTTDLIAGSIKKKLKPIFDKNQGMSKGEAILGFEAEGTGLKEGFEVIGALSGSVGRDWSKDAKKNLKKQIDDVRSWGYFYLRLKLSSLPATALLLMDPEEMVKTKRDNLYRDLCTEKNLFLNGWIRFLFHNVLTNYAEILVNLLNSYYIAHNYRELMNLAAKTQSKGMVADAGQLMAINAAMATKHATTPAYLGKQTIDTKDKDVKGWVNVTQEAGEVNFNQDNPTMLFIGLTMRYPAIPHEDLSKWIGELMGKRELSGMGFDQQQCIKFYQELGTKNTVAVQGLLPPN